MTLAKGKEQGLKKERNKMLAKVKKQDHERMQLNSQVALHQRLGRHSPIK